MQWYAKNTSAGQTLIIDEDNGKSIAVAYFQEDGPLIAAAPDLLAACEEAIAFLRKHYGDETHTIIGGPPVMLYLLLKEAVDKAK